MELLEHEANMLQRERDTMVVPVARESLVIKRLQEKIKRYEDLLGDKRAGGGY